MTRVGKISLALLMRGLLDLTFGWVLVARGTNATEHKFTGLMHSEAKQP